MNLLDLPPDIIHKIFGHGDDIKYELYTDHAPDSTQLTHVMTNFVGWHVCHWIRTILGKHNVGGVAGLAAYTGQFAVCKWAVDYGYFPEDGNDICVSAVYSGSIRIIRWAQSRGYAPTAKVVRTAALIGNFEILEHYIELVDCINDKKLFAAAMIGGNIEILNYIYRNNLVRYDDRMIPSFITAPISSFEWGRSHGYSFDRLSYYAMIYRRIDLLDWLYDNHRDWFGISMYMLTSGNVVQTDDVPTVNWFVERNIISTSQVLRTAVRCTCVNILHDIFDRADKTTMAVHMIHVNYINAIKIARSYGHLWPANTVELIINRDMSDNLWAFTPKFLVFMKEDGYPLHELQKIPQMYEAAGYLDRAQWVREMVFDECVCNNDSHQ